MILFSRFKKTEIVEKERQQLANDFSTYCKIENSDKLKEYLFLKDKVESTTFKNTRRDIESAKWKGSPEYKLEKEYEKLKNNAKMKVYLSAVGSDELKHYDKVVASKLPEEYAKLSDYMKSGKYQSEQKSFNERKKKDKNFNERWEDSEAYSKHKRFNDIQSNADFCRYAKFNESKTLKVYKQVNNSAMLSRYNDLHKEVSSDVFKKKKEYLLDKKRYETTSDFVEFQRYETLKSDPEILLYTKYYGTDKFKFFRNWKHSFSDDFKDGVNSSIWKGITPIAEKGPGRQFTSTGLFHGYDNVKNIDTKGNVLTIGTIAEKNEGLYWDSKFGFIKKSFSCTTAMIHSIPGYTQQYGYFDVKLKMSRSKGIRSTVSLFDENEDNAIILFSALDNESYGGIVTTSHDRKEVQKVNLKYPFNGYVIVGVKWMPEKLVWRVNGKDMGVLTQNVPHTKLGLRIESEVVRETARLPHRLDIDWIHCYVRNSPNETGKQK